MEDRVSGCFNVNLLAYEFLSQQIRVVGYHYRLFLGQTTTETTTKIEGNHLDNTKTILQPQRHLLLQRVLPMPGLTNG